MHWREKQEGRGKGSNSLQDTPQRLSTNEGNERRGKESGGGDA